MVNLPGLELGYTPRNPPKDTEAAPAKVMLSLGLWFLLAWV